MSNTSPTLSDQTPAKAAGGMLLLVTDKAVPSELITLVESQNLSVQVWKTVPGEITRQTLPSHISYIAVEQTILHSSTDVAVKLVALNIPLLALDLNSNKEQTNGTHSAAIDFAYIHWPCSIMQLNVQLEISAYKLSVRKVYENKLNLLENTIACIGETVIYLDDQGNLRDFNQNAAALFASHPQQLLGQPWYALIKTRQDLSAKHTEQFISTAVKIQAVTKLQPFAIQTSGGSSQLADGIVGPITYPDGNRGVVIVLRNLTDLDALSNEIGAQSELISLPSKSDAASGILLVSPDNFNDINLRFGRRIGDQLLFLIGEQLGKFVRTTDLASHYGGAIFLVMFSDSNEAQIRNIVKSLHQHLSQFEYPHASNTLTFSMGLALNTGKANVSPVELFYQANVSLAQARELGGAQIREWQHQNTLQQIGNLDRLSGNVSGDRSSDYQKMLMLWRILNELDNEENAERFIHELLKYLATGLNLRRAAFFRIDQGSPQLQMAVDKQGKPVNSEQMSLSTHQQAYLQDVVNQASVHGVFTSMLPDSGLETLVPIKVHNALGGVLCLTCITDAITQKDHHLLNNIADFAAMALEKFAASHAGAGDTSDQSPFWYQSEAMQQVMENIKLVAATNATVLITGESGTGKEMLAKSIHQHSPRKNKPLVIFDCGAMVENLIESELFGHVKGAFTGAITNKTGRIADAEGGTLFLDEIGELPIETQVKLLRFVQEMQYTPVGSAQLKKVDVRIIAATNVDLQQRIKQGLFREDLYFRLNVFSLESIPLRDRVDDILLLANNYLAQYAKQYNKPTHDFTDKARQALLQYQWPGNIRELKNLVHRAAILCSDSVMDCSHLGLFPSDENQHQTTQDTLATTAPTMEPLQPMGTAAINDTNAFNPGTNTAHLPEEIAQAMHICQSLIRIHMDMPSERTTTPLAPFLESMMYNLGLSQSHGVTLRAADTLNIAESTFRRRWKTLQTITLPDNQQWLSQAQGLVNRLMNTTTSESRILLMQQVLVLSSKQLKVSAKTGCVLLDASAPTYRKVLASTELSFQ